MRSFLVPVVLLAFGVGVTEAVENDRLNILLITADDLGLQLSSYGDNTAVTRHLDRFADQAVRFRTAYVTQASCSPSRSTLFTGLYPHANGHYGLANANVGFQVHPELLDRLLPNVLKRHGYRTGIVGKLHVNPMDSFDFDMSSREGFGERDVRHQVGIAEAFINGKPQDRPWFLMFNVFDPHTAYIRQPDGSRGPRYFPDQVLGLPEKVLTPADIRPWPWQRIDHPQQRTKVAGYYNCVQRVDAAVGLLMDVLARTAHEDNTVILLLGDHGPPFTRGKTSCYEAGLRVPFIVQWPGVSEPHVSDRLISSADVYPTILDAAAIDLPAELHGESLRPILTQSTQTPWRETLVGEFHFHGAATCFPRRAIRDRRYKLIHNLDAGRLRALDQVDGDEAFRMAHSLPVNDPIRLAFERLKNPPRWELYDLREDPIEFRNRAGDPAFAEVESRLRRQLADWQQATQDPFRDPQFRREVEAKYSRAR